MSSILAAAEWLAATEPRLRAYVHVAIRLPSDREDALWAGIAAAYIAFAADGLPDAALAAGVAAVRVLSRDEQKRSRRIVLLSRPINS
jgi:hypothetical protein